MTLADKITQVYDDEPFYHPKWFKEVPVACRIVTPAYNRLLLNVLSPKRIDLKDLEVFRSSDLVDQLLTRLEAASTIPARLPASVVKQRVAIGLHEDATEFVTGLTRSGQLATVVQKGRQADCFDDFLGYPWLRAHGTDLLGGQNVLTVGGKAPPLVRHALTAASAKAIMEPFTPCHVLEFEQAKCNYPFASAESVGGWGFAWVRARQNTIDKSSRTYPFQDPT
ncbi:hypothetical protein K437DRAFT_262455 [Tilletiaria anomala UBC 951]|uniref:Uncharacterized protein n=1 Tax=Tilletiaria anomala (strain ATCC 24038 / CBS 436.72 / UBC 951) TaxID=1037660 RepID=A0A066W8D1_TILAU|nr:uncharacterized protein K437DRAFT_262455 [Tilletiaria anomala UBC 951]KDN47319.1 hypothetical protein K437DRAFT_262455 [Tilletiaria anomala UBC 951]